ncbi:hypothetical protein D3C81_1787790 [compost metagenome]
MVFQPGTQARRAASRGPGGEKDELGGRQAGHDNGDQADAEADVGQEAEQHAGEFRGGGLRHGLGIAVRRDGDLTDL